MGTWKACLGCSGRELAGGGEGASSSLVNGMEFTKMSCRRLSGGQHRCISPPSVSSNSPSSFL